MMYEFFIALGIGLMVFGTLAMIWWVILLGAAIAAVTVLI